MQVVGEEHIVPHTQWMELEMKAEPQICPTVCMTFGVCLSAAMVCCNATTRILDTVPPPSASPRQNERTESRGKLQLCNRPWGLEICPCPARITQPTFEGVQTKQGNHTSNLDWERETWRLNWNEAATTSYLIWAIANRKDTLMKRGTKELEKLYDLKGWDRKEDEVINTKRWKDEEEEDQMAADHHQNQSTR